MTATEWEVTGVTTITIQWRLTLDSRTDDCASSADVRDVARERAHQIVKLEMGRNIEMGDNIEVDDHHCDVTIENAKVTATRTVSTKVVLE